MIYMTAGNRHIIILETANLQELQKGRPCSTPDREVFIAWTPDPVWLADKIIDTNGDGSKISALIEESTKRPQKPVDRKYHDMVQVTFPKGE